MSQYFYNAMVLHKPSEYRYEVSIKKKWYSRWEYVTYYEYYKVNASVSNPLSQDAAKQCAIRDAENFLSWNVVYDKRKREVTL